MRAADTAYGPVREVIERRLAEQAAAHRAAGVRAYEEQERRRQKAEVRFREWERRQALADRPLPDGPTPRELAATGDEPASWPAELVAQVADVGVWWSGLRASVRNEQARAGAVRDILEAINATAAALDAAGRPGLIADKEAPNEQLFGWWIAFDWSGLPDSAVLRVPPDMPVGHLLGGRWDYDLYLPDRRLFTPTMSGYQFATVTTESIANGMAQRHRWWKQGPEDFANSLVPAWISYTEQYGMYRHVRTPMVDHADPDVYVPYVQAVARLAVLPLRALTPSQC
ncbi:hypothetical protein F8271_07815 [Micromonospora sp. ALFpr18c]|nr:hypothetical protein F8271_07815 [Micromonospora sp. ALFpr18c]